MCCRLGTQVKSAATCRLSTSAARSPAGGGPLSAAASNARHGARQGECFALQWRDLDWDGSLCSHSTHFRANEQWLRFPRTQDEGREAKNSNSTRDDGVAPWSLRRGKCSEQVAARSRLSELDGRTYAS